MAARHLRGLLIAGLIAVTGCEDPTASPTVTVSPPADAASPTPTTEPSPTAVPHPPPPLDLDGDGYGDVIIPNAYNGDTFALDSDVYYGAASGIDPTDRTTLPTLNAQQACVADFNGDGHNDIAFANHSDGASFEISSYVYWGDTTGFDPARRAELPTLGASGCAAGDFNRDGWPDLAFANQRSDDGQQVSSYVYQGSAEGLGRRVELVTDGAAAVTAADLDDDGFMELIFSNIPPDRPASVYLFWGDEAGWPPFDPDVLASPGTDRPVSVADANGDDHPDILIDSGGQTEGDAAALLHLGPAFIGAPITLPVSGASASLIADLNLDGHADIAFACRGDDDPSTTSLVYLGEGASWPTAQTLDTGSALAVASRDVDGDGFPELLFGAHFDGDFMTNSSLYFGSAQGFDRGRVARLNGHATGSVALADLDQDGWVDAILAGSTDEDSSVSTTFHYGSARGFDEAARSALPHTGAQMTEIFDLNGDGFPELIVPSFEDGTTHRIMSKVWWGGAGGPNQEAVTELPTQGALWACAADFDGNGHGDVVFANFTDDGSYEINSYVYWGDETGLSEARRAELPTQGATQCEVADVDGDGDLDLVFSHFSTDTSQQTHSRVYTYEGDGFSVDDPFDLPTIGATGVRARDLNDDGHMELIFSNYADGVNYSVGSYLYWGSEDGWSEASRTLLPSHGPRSAAEVVDLNGDGRLDIIMPGYFDGDNTVETYVYYGAEGGYSEGLRDVLTAHRTFSTHVDDFNGDARPDILLVTELHQDGVAEAPHYLYWGSEAGFTDANRQELSGFRALRADSADLNGDPYPDLVIGTFFDGDYTTSSPIWLGSETGYSSERQIPLSSFGTRDVSLTDLNGDGYEEVILTHSQDDDFEVDSYQYWGSARGYGDGAATTVPNFATRTLTYVGE